MTPFSRRTSPPAGTFRAGIRRVVLSAFACIVAVAIFAPPGAAAEPEPYPLVCRGGGAMTLLVRDEGEGPQFIARFARAPRGASAAPPSAGECAWLDRPVSNDEPDRLFFLFYGAKFETVFSGGNAHLTFSVRRTGDEAARTQVLWAHRIQSAILGGEVFRVMARRSTGYLWALSEAR